MIQTLAFVALFAAGLTLVLRATVAKRWVFRGMKPWACDLCMSWWCSYMGSLALYVLLGTHEPGELAVHALLVPFAATPVSMLVLRWASQPRSDFDLPEG